MKAYEGEELQAFLTSALDRSEGQPAALPRGKVPPQGTGWAQSRSGHGGKEKNCLSQSGIES
jgi:hypothetical protein